MDHIPFLVFVLWTACISDIRNVNVRFCYSVFEPLLAFIMLTAWHFWYYLYGLLCISDILNVDRCAFLVLFILWTPFYYYSLCGPLSSSGIIFVDDCVLPILIM